VVTLAMRMQKEIEHVRKEAHVASMERVTQLTDENISLGKQIVQLRCDLNEVYRELDRTKAALALSRAANRITAAAIRRLSREKFDLKQEISRLTSVELNPRLALMIEEDIRRARSC
jgi:uncharacterized coiled-coil DUF342 family protein